MADEEEDLVVESAGVQIVKCPITQTKIKDPYRNEKCGHIYEKEAIQNYTKGKKKLGNSFYLFKHLIPLI